MHCDSDSVMNNNKKTLNRSSKRSDDDMNFFFLPTREVIWLLWKLHPQSFSIIFIQTCQCGIRQNVMVRMGWVGYLHLKETSIKCSAQRSKITT